MIKLLIIEDNRDQTRMIKYAIAAFNVVCQTDDNRIEADYFKDDTDVYKSVFHVKYDCIILDINWGRGKEIGGKELAVKIKNSKRIPVFVYSGHIAEIDEIEEQLGFRKFARTTPFSVLISEVVKIKQMKIFDLLGYEGIVDKKILNIFWKDIKDTQEFLSNIPDHDNANALTRLFTTRAIESLNSDSTTSNQNFFEFYIFPSLSSAPRNGDIYKRIKQLGEEMIVEYFLIITPTCQMLNGSVNNVNLLKIDFVHDQIISELRPVAGQNRVDRLDKYVNKHKSYPSKHFIPPFKSLIKMGFINFNEIYTIPTTELIEANKIVTVNPAYMKDIQSRFAQYFSRQGQPDINVEHLLRTVLRD